MPHSTDALDRLNALPLHLAEQIEEYDGRVRGERRLKLYAPWRWAQHEGPPDVPAEPEWPDWKWPRRQCAREGCESMEPASSTVRWRFCCGRCRAAYAYQSKRR
jgi:hypothetical protein